VDALRELLHAIEDWLVAWADSPAGPGALAALTASEAVFFPIPPDPLLIALALRNPSAALWLAALTTVSSVLGALVGHWLGLRFGRPLLLRMHARHAVRVEAMFQRHRFWAIVIAALTPIPFKVFTIAAGVFGIPRGPFVIAAIVGRGARFFLLGVLVLIWGERVTAFLDERFDLVMAAMGVMLVVALLVFAYWARRNGRRAALLAPEEAEAGK
jgi:membrane protein YqaA with SNARE-associated domain